MTDWCIYFIFFYNVRDTQVNNKLQYVYTLKLERWTFNGLSTLIVTVINWTNQIVYIYLSFIKTN